MFDFSESKKNKLEELRFLTNDGLMKIELMNQQLLKLKQTD